MSKAQIASMLFRMKKTQGNIMSFEGELYSADELLSHLYGRPVGEDEGKDFITHDSESLTVTHD